jgi:hypothetical protein
MSIFNASQQLRLVREKLKDMDQQYRLENRSEIESSTVMKTIDPVDFGEYDQVSLL